MGRETDLQTLNHALERASASHGRLTTIVGEPRVGKSRLVYEFTHSPVTQGWQVLAGS